MGRSLRRFNAVMAVVHGSQALLMVLLANARSLPVTGVFANGPAGQPDRPLEVDHLFSYRLGWAIAGFELISALFHALVASPWGFRRYVVELEHHRNRFRW